MRTLAVAVATGFVALVLAGPVAALPSIDLIWTGTSGTGVTGTNSIDAAVGDTLTLDVIIVVDSDGTKGGGLQLTYDSSALFASGATECPSPPNIAPGLCSVGAVFFTPIVPGVIISNIGAGSTIASYDAANPTTAVFNTTITLGRATFVVSAGGTVDTLYGGADGITDGFNNPVTFPAASASVVVPEPGTVGLLGLGLMALGVAGRRRS